MRIIVTGYIGHYAFGGVAWDYLPYIFGLQLLGHDVWYLEDTGTWAYHPLQEEHTSDCSHNLKYLRKVMDTFGLGDRWIYRNEADGIYHGEAKHAEKIFAEADALINVSGACWLRDTTAQIPRKIFIDTDPMFNQISTAGNLAHAQQILAHTRHYTYALHIGAPDCEVPTGAIRWIPIMQPVSLSHWEKDPQVLPDWDAWTTVMNWASYAPKEFQSKLYGQKDMEFLKCIDLPSLCSEKFMLAIGQGLGRSRPTSKLNAKGWRVLEPDEIVPDFESYRSFLMRSKGEWSVAKHGYVAAKTGWFSCRTAFYLASGRPAVIQDTGWTEYLPEGLGLLSFRTVEEAAQKIRQVSQNYSLHSQAARNFVREHLDAQKICARLLEE